MAAANPLWGAERVRGELLKLDIRVAKSTIQRYLRGARPPRHAGQPWATFLRNHAPDIWACDFLPVTDLLFRPLYAFCVIALETRRVVHVGVTQHPTDAWVAQQLREATPFGQRLSWPFTPSAATSWYRGAAPPTVPIRCCTDRSPEGVSRLPGTDHARARHALHPLATPLLADRRHRQSWAICQDA